MYIRHCAMGIGLFAAWALPVVAAPPGSSALEFFAQQGPAGLEIEGNENNPTVIGQLSLTCPANGWVVVRGNGQFTINDDGDDATALQLAIALDFPAFFAVHSEATGHRAAWEILYSGDMPTTVHTPASGERIEPCNKGQKSTYYFIAAQNNLGDHTTFGRVTLVAQFFRSRTRGLANN